MPRIYWPALVMVSASTVNMPVGYFLRAGASYSHYLNVKCQGLARQRMVSVDIG